nr:acyl-CoA:lysophosphatidylglycerol acyltransferase 1-like isoform X1 [Onthophagus taurus]
MDSIRFYLENWYVIPKAIFRLCFILVNNAYCIPTYVIWMIMLSPIRRFNPDTFWRIEGYFFHWLLAMVSMWSWSAGYDVVEVGDDISHCIDDRTLVIANHQSTADVPFLMACFNTRKNVLPNLMWIMDRLFKFTNFGIVSVIHQDFFIMSGKENREKSIQSLVQHLLESYIPRKRKWMVLFPEGGFLRKRRAVSQRYAEKNNLPVLNHVSLPRVGALKAIMNTVGPLPNNNSSLDIPNGLPKPNERLTWVLDITVAYPNGEPLDLGQIIFGYRPPCKTTIFYRVYECKDVPQDEEAQTRWLYNLFEEKERLLDMFYKTGKFPISEYCKNPAQPHVVAQDCLRYLILHLFFITSTYVHIQMFMAVYEYCNYLMY